MILRADNIQKIYGSRKVVKGISLVEPLIRLKYKKYIHQIGKQSGYFDFKSKFADLISL